MAWENFHNFFRVQPMCHLFFFSFPLGSVAESLGFSLQVGVSFLSSKLGGTSSRYRTAIPLLPPISCNWVFQ